MDSNYSSSAAAAHEGICVGIRMRPLNEREVQSGQHKVFQCQTDHNAISQIRASDGQLVDGQTYHYDKVFDETAGTEAVYEHIGKQLVNGVMNGINGTIFAYGQTSSGKTHTMLGGGQQLGVLNMAAEDIFEFINDHPHRDFLLRASFVEIYNENIRDLLSDANDTSVAIREDPRKGVYCEALEVMITDYESIIRALQKGISRRAVESTAMNDTSSRSHTIFRLVVESRESIRSGHDVDGAVLVSTLNLVDLAGSESVKHTGAMGQRAKEGGKINQSLLSLSRVIHALSQPGVHVNYRDSKLTRLLQPSLSGNAKMSIVCCITPADRYLEETRSTLQFASRAKLVETHATVNEVLDENAQIRRLKKELEELKSKHRNSSLSSASSEESHQVEELRSRCKQLEEERDQLRGELEKQSCTIGNKRQRCEEDENDENAVPQNHDAIKAQLTALFGQGSKLPISKSSSLSSFAAPVTQPPPPTRQAESSQESSSEPSQRGPVGGLQAQLMMELGSKISSRRANIEDNPDTGNSEPENHDIPAQEIANLKAELEKERSANQALQDELNSVKGERDSLNQQLDLEMGANAEYQTEQQSVQKNLEAKILMLEGELETVLGQLEEAVAASAPSANADDIEELRERLAANISSNAETTAQLQQVEEAKMQLAIELDSLRNDLSQALSRIATFEAAEEASAQLNKRTVELEERLTKEISVNKLLQDSLDAVNAQYEECSKELSKARDEFENLAEKRRQSSCNHQHAADESDLQLRQMTREYEDRCVELTSTINQQEEKLADLNQQVEAMKGTIKSIEQERDALKEQLSNLMAAQVEFERIHSESAASEITDLELKIRELEEKNEEITTALKEAETTHQLNVSESQQKLDVVQNELNAMVDAKDAELADLQSKIVELEANASCTSDLMSELEASLEKALQDQSDAEAALESKTQEFSDWKEENSANLQSAKEEIAGLQEKLDQVQLLAEEQRVQIEKERGSAAASSMLHMDELKLSQQELDNARRSMEKQLEAMNADLGQRDGEISRLRQTITELEERVNVAEQSVNCMNKKEEEHSGLEENMKKRISQLQTNFDLLKGEKSQLLEKLQEQQKEVKQLTAELCKQNEYLQQISAQQEIEAQKLADQKLAIEKLERTIALAEEEKKNLLEQLESKGNELQQLRDAAAAAATAAGVSDVSDDAVSGFENTVKELRHALAEKDKALDVVTEEKSRLAADINEISSRLKRSHDECKSLKEEWEVACDHRQAAENDLIAAQEEVSKLNNQLKDGLLSSEIDITELKATFVAEKGTLIEQISSLEADLKEAIASAESKDMELSSEADHVKSLQESLSYVSEKNESLKAQIFELKEQLAATTQSDSTLVDSLENAREQLAATDSMISTLEERIAVLQQENEGVQSLLNESVAEQARLTAVIGKKEEEVTSLQTSLTATEQAASDLKEVNKKQEEMISSFDHKAALEQEAYVSAAQMQIDKLRVALEEMTEAHTEKESERDQLFIDLEKARADFDGQRAQGQEYIQALQAELAELKANVVSDEAREQLSRRIQELEAAAQEREEAMAQVENELFQVQQELRLSSDTADGLQKLEDTIAGHEETIRMLRQDLQAANEHCALNEDIIKRLQGEAEAKDKRLVHLEACKLTKDQMEKIKTIKAERKKYQEDNKILKKQLHQLNIKFDELRAATNITTGAAECKVGEGSAQEYVISDLKVQMVVVNQQLMQAQEEVKLLKEKLKECALQLKDYENDHKGIIAILDKYEIDTRGLLLLERSVDDDSAFSAQHPDIADAVSQLGELLDAARTAATRKDASKAEKQQDLEEKLRQQMELVEDCRGQKFALEKRIDAMKATAKSAREENANLSIQVETLQGKLEDIKGQLEAAEKKAVSSDEFVSSEVQALEEENIDLLRENKELRTEISRYKAAGRSLPPVEEPVVHESPAGCKEEQLDVASVGKKRPFGTDISNQQTVQNCESSLDKRQIATETPADDAPKSKARRGRVKAKAVLNETLPKDEAGECKQS